MKYKTCRVKKFGGSSLADLQRIKNVAQIVARAYTQQPHIAVVVSAMQGETNRLIALARNMGIGCERESAAILATGEQVSAALLSIALQDIGIAARSFNGLQLAIHTQGQYATAGINCIDTQRLQDAFDQKIVPVVTGFQGANQRGDITNLGRGGSDLTAVALAVALQAQECHIYTDVAGIYTADPRLTERACKLQQISYDEVFELASEGAQVLQKESLLYACRYRMPIRVLSSFQPQEQGTLVTFANDTTMQHALISGVTINRQIVQFSLTGIPKRPGLASYLLSALSQAQIVIDMLMQVQNQSQGLVDINFVIAEPDYPRAKALLDNLMLELQAQQLVINDQIVKLSVIGLGLRSQSHIIAGILSALGKQGIDVIEANLSEIKIAVLIDSVYAELAVRTLHQSFESMGVINHIQ